MDLRVPRSHCDKVTEECEAKSVPCDQAQVAISGAQLLLVRSVSGCCRCRWPATFPGGGCLLVALALFARKASMLVHACHLVLSSLCTRLGASCSFHGFACWGCSWWMFAQFAHDVS